MMFTCVYLCYGVNSYYCKYANASIYKTEINIQRKTKLNLHKRQKHPNSLIHKNYSLIWTAVKWPLLCNALCLVQGALCNAPCALSLVPWALSLVQGAMRLVPWLEPSARCSALKSAFRCPRSGPEQAVGSSWCNTGNNP